MKLTGTAQDDEGGFSASSFDKINTELTNE